MSGRHIVFLLNLLQDVNVIRPLAYLAAREFDGGIAYLVSAGFLKRDNLRLWQRELGQIAAETGGTIHIYSTPLDALAMLQDKHGVLVAASESTLSAHVETHDVFRLSPAGFLKVTLQHGYECVGFLQNREHVIAHGRNIRFGADVVCGWCEAPYLTSLAASERPKLYVSGPPMVLNRTPSTGGQQDVHGGLICENLHSVRLRATGNHGKSFMDNFERFCARLAGKGQRVNLRPHPSGQYVIRNNIALPPNVVLNSAPIYKVNLAAFDFGVSAPSTVVLDMVLASIPTAVWRDEQGIMDASNYEGLVPVSGLDSWLAFAEAVSQDREAILERQRAFLGRIAMPTDPADVYGRFARLLGGAASIGEVSIRAEKAPVPPRRIAFIANSIIPTLQISFLKPLQSLIDSGEIATDFITEVEAIERFPLKTRGKLDTSDARLDRVGGWIEKRLAAFAPDLVVACRYSAPGAGHVAAWARQANVPLVYHIDDDLLNIPREIGEKKFLAHNQPSRLAAVDTLLRGADLVYASTTKLKARLRQLSYRTPMVTGPIYCSGHILNRASFRPVRRVGYMGVQDHAHDLAMIVPQLVRYLRRNTEVIFELFGSIEKPKQLEEFGERVFVSGPVQNYNEFLTEFAKRNWDIGLCPLVKMPFNEVRANTKWVDYTCVGAAVLASRDLVYDGCCTEGCGLLLGEGEWLEALERLTDDPGLRFDMVSRAQTRVEQDYSVKRLKDQVLSVFAEASRLKRAAKSGQWFHHPHGPFETRAQPVTAEM